MPHEVIQTISRMTGAGAYRFEDLMRQCDKSLPIWDTPKHQHLMLPDSLLQRSLCERWPIAREIRSIRVQLNIEVRGEAIQPDNQIVIAVRRLSPPVDSAFFKIGYCFLKKP